MPTEWCINAYFGSSVSVLRRRYCYGLPITETGAIERLCAYLQWPRRDRHQKRVGARFDRLLAVYSNVVLALRGRVACLP